MLIKRLYSLPGVLFKNDLNSTHLFPITALSGFLPIASLKRHAMLSRKIITENWNKIMPFDDKGTFHPDERSRQQILRNCTTRSYLNVRTLHYEVTKTQKYHDKESYIKAFQTQLHAFNIRNFAKSIDDLIEHLITSSLNEARVKYLTEKSRKGSECTHDHIFDYLCRELRKPAYKEAIKGYLSDYWKTELEGLTDCRKKQSSAEEEGSVTGQEITQFMFKLSEVADAQIQNNSVSNEKDESILYNYFKSPTNFTPQAFSIGMFAMNTSLAARLIQSAMVGVIEWLNNQKEHNPILWCKIPNDQSSFTSSTCNFKTNNLELLNSQYKALEKLQQQVPSGARFNSSCVICCLKTGYQSIANIKLQIGNVFDAIENLRVHLTLGNETSTLADCLSQLQDAVNALETATHSNNKGTAILSPETLTGFKNFYSQVSDSCSNRLPPEEVVNSLRITI